MRKIEIGENLTPEDMKIFAGFMSFCSLVAEKTRNEGYACVVFEKIQLFLRMLFNYYDLIVTESNFDSTESSAQPARLDEILKQHYYLQISWETLVRYHHFKDYKEKQPGIFNKKVFVNITSSNFSAAVRPLRKVVMYERNVSREHRLNSDSYPPSEGLSLEDLTLKELSLKDLSLAPPESSLADFVGAATKCLYSSDQMFVSLCKAIIIHLRNILGHEPVLSRDACRFLNPLLKSTDWPSYLAAKIENFAVNPYELGYSEQYMSNYINRVHKQLQKEESLFFSFPAIENNFVMDKEILNFEQYRQILLHHLVLGRIYLMVTSEKKLNKECIKRMVINILMKNFLTDAAVNSEISENISGVEVRNTAKRLFKKYYVSPFKEIWKRAPKSLSQASEVFRREYRKELGGDEISIKDPVCLTAGKLNWVLMGLLRIGRFKDVEFSVMIQPAVAMMQSFASLTEFNLVHRIEHRESVSNEIIPAIVKVCKNLESLNLSYVPQGEEHGNISDEGLESLQDLKHLKKLYLNNQGLTEQGLENLLNGFLIFQCLQLQNNQINCISAKTWCRLLEQKHRGIGLAGNHLSEDTLNELDYFYQKNNPTKRTNWFGFSLVKAQHSLTEDSIDTTEPSNKKVKITDDFLRYRRKLSTAVPSLLDLCIFKIKKFDEIEGVARERLFAQFDLSDKLAEDLAVEDFLSDDLLGKYEQDRREIINY